MQSGEANQDSEPNVAVNPVNPQEVAATAFTPSPNVNAVNSAIYYSNDGAITWTLLDIIGGTPVRDQTLRFASTSGELYAGVLWGQGLLPQVNFDILRTNDFSGMNVMTRLVNPRKNDDQPFVHAATVPNGPDAGKDRIYVGSNDHAPANIPATIDLSLDALASTTASPNTQTVVVESRKVSRDGFQTRPAIHINGPIYAIYYSIYPDSSGADVVIVRDDNWASGTKPFSALVDKSDPMNPIPGIRIATGVANPLNLPALGASPPNQQGQRIGGDLSIAVDPNINNSATVYVCWGDMVGGVYMLQVKKSIDSGFTWSNAPLRPITNATNPALAINNSGRLGFLYQQVVTDPQGNQFWQTTLELTTDDFDHITTHILANTPAGTPASAGQPYLGDYLYMMAVGDSFHGVFCANNTPDTNNFPSSVAYQRNADFAAQTLLDTDLKTPVNISIDPFFFTVSITPDNVIAGFVLDTNGNPIVDAAIAVTASDGTFIVEVSTDSRGHYTTPVLAAGVYGVSATQTGFVPANANVTVLDPVLLTIQNFVLTATLPYTVQGQVTDTNGNPIAGATVRLTANSAVPGILTTQTDATGHYSFSNEDPGPYAGDYTEDVSAPGFTSTSRTFIIPNGATLPENFVLEQQGVLTGHVTDMAAGTPLGGALVSLGTPQTFTDSTGLYTIMVNPGQYTATASLTGFTPKEASVTILSGQTVPQDFALVPAVPGTITGTVTDDSGSPLGRAKVAAQGAGATRTDDNGNYTLSVLPGTYAVTASAGIHFDTQTSTVTVAEGQMVPLDFILVAKGSRF
jgi:protocatechuate 3,4-dioxygenase beta subunit